MVYYRGKTPGRGKELSSSADNNIVFPLQAAVCDSSHFLFSVYFEYRV